MRELIVIAGMPLRATVYALAGMILLLSSLIDVKMLDYWKWAEVKRKVVGR